MPREDLLSLRTQVRALLDEQNANLFSDDELDRDISKGCQLATRESQLLRLPYQITTAVDQMEYPTPLESTDILKVYYWYGANMTPLTRMNAVQAPSGVKVNSARPTRFFIKPFVSLKMNQLSTNNIGLTALSDASNDWRSVVGIWPPPSNAGDIITVDAYIVHPKMKEDTDKCLIPDDFTDAPIYYATFKGLLKAKFYAEAATYQTLYNNMVEEMANVVKFGGSADHPMMKTDDGFDGPLNPHFHDIWVD